MAFRKTKKEYDEPALFEYAVGALARKMRSVAEIKRVLRQRTQSAELIESVVGRLKELRYLNDREYAATYTSYRKSNEKFGRNRVITDLKNKGVHGDVINEAVSAAYSETDEEQLARDYLARKRMRKPEDRKQAARIFRALLRAGFNGRIATRVLNQWDVDPEVITELQEAAEQAQDAPKED